jgi:hypothetical protein
MKININIKNIKLNKEIRIKTIVKMEKTSHDSFAQYYKMYIEQETSKGLNEFQSSVKFLMDENVPQKYKDRYRKHQNQIVEAMDLDEIPDPPKLVRS